MNEGKCKHNPLQECRDCLLADREARRISTGIMAGLAARTLGVSTVTLAKWADQGLLRVDRMACGWRLYNPQDVERLWRKRSKKKKCGG